MCGARQLALVCLAFTAMAVGVTANKAAAQGTRGPYDPRGSVVESPPPTGGRPEGRFQLHPTREGGYVYDGSRFSARIAPDGSVSFSTHHFGLSPDGPDPSTVGIDTVTPQDPISGRFPVAVESRPGVRFDATDEYLRLLGKDPLKGDKLAFLEATFDLRMNMAIHAGRRQQQAALSDLPARLDGMWRDPRLSPDERVHLLRAMWDELAEGPEADPAREIIRAFARSHLTAEEAAPFR